MTVCLRVYYDFASPFCYIARAVLERMRHTHSFEVEWLPFEVIDYLPPQGAMPQNPAFVRRAEARFAAERGRDYGLEGLRPGRLLNSNLALCAVEHARTVETAEGAIGLLERVHAAIFDAYWRDGVDVGTLDTVVEIAARAGLSHDLSRALEDGRHREIVAQSRSAAHDLGVVAVPTFLAGGYAVVGIPEFAAFEQLLERAAAGVAGAPTP